MTEDLFGEAWMADAESGDDFTADPHYDAAAAWAAGDDWPPGHRDDDYFDLKFENDLAADLPHD